ncbi:MAG TPA: hypothetical protein VGJ66_10275 [Pyrinomonadaceae bacterium]
MAVGVEGVARRAPYRGRRLRATVASERMRWMTVRVMRRAARVFIVVE